MIERRKKLKEDKRTMTKIKRIGTKPTKLNVRASENVRGGASERGSERGWEILTKEQVSNGRSISSQWFW